LQIKVLGSGASVGTPVIGCTCQVCNSTDLYDKRLRQSIYILKDNTSVIVDCGPDIRQQCLSNGIQKIDALFLTHAHQDHVGGIDDLRAFVYTSCKPLDVYLDVETLGMLKERFGYVFSYKVKNRLGQRTDIIKTHILEPGVKYNVAENLEFEVFEQDHGFAEGMGRLKSLGFLFPNEGFAYSTDVKRMDDAVFKKLHDARLKVWFLETLGKAVGGYEAHISLTETISWIDRVKPDKGFLIHISHELLHAELLKTLPKHIRPAHDGMLVEL